MQRLALVPRPRLHLIRFHGALAPHAKQRAAVVPDVVQPASEIEHKHAHGQAARMSWARLLKRVFDIAIERCACAGQLKIIAAIEDPVVIARILTHLGRASFPSTTQPESLTGEQDDGSAAVPTGVLGPRLRDGVKARRVNADPGRCCARIVTARGNFSPVSARLTARSTDLVQIEHREREPVQLGHDQYVALLYEFDDPL